MKKRLTRTQGSRPLPFAADMPARQRSVRGPGHLGDSIVR
jgi:hypothetical protein